MMINDVILTGIFVNDKEAALEFYPGFLCRTLDMG
jgi:hypothetical protein